MLNVWTDYLLHPQNPTPSVSFAWDSVYPRINTMTDGTGKTRFGYVAAGDNGALQLETETGPIGAPAEYAYGYDELVRVSQLSVAGVPQDATTYDPIGRDSADVTPLGQFNTAYLGETDQVNTVTALGQSISGSPGLTTYGYLPNSGDRRCRANSAPTKRTITCNAAAA